MRNMAKIIIGTRGSLLALEQTSIVARALQVVDPTMESEVRVVTTRGDTDFKPIPLDTVGKGWFTKEIEDGLLDGSIGLAVHSLKDMAEEMPKGLTIGAYLAREDARDVLVTKHGTPLEALPPGAIIGTDSIRRHVQMLALRPDVVVRSLRGSVPTRLEKLQTEEYDAIILAAAGLKRLGLEEKITRYFEPSEVTPSPGQGILAIQVREDNAHLRDVLVRIHDAAATRAAKIERSFSRAMGGGCKSPTGAYALQVGDEWRLTGMVADESGSKILRDEMRAAAAQSETLGEMLAKRLLEKLHE